MSLAGNLSDLSLPELLQVVALSRKTGALEICSEQGGVAWLGLRDGGIVRVALESGDLDRDEILRKAGLEPGGDSDVAAAMLWDAAVQAILGIFDWSEGDFTFEPLDDPALQWRGPQGILLPSPLSPEFLALEGARLEDESAAQRDAAEPGKSAVEVIEPEPDAAEPPEWRSERDEEAPAAVDDDAGEPAVEVPIVEPPPEPEAPPELEALPEPPPRAEDDTPFRLQRGEGKTLPAARRPLLDPDATMVAQIPLISDEPITAGVPRPEPRLPSSLICIDPDLPLLERVKSGLAQDPVRVHIFQKADDALARFKQYVVRGEIPAVVLGSGVEDPLDARQGLGWRRFAGRLLAIAPRMRLVVLARPGESVAAPGLAVVQRPEARTLVADLEHFLRALRDALAAGA
ncbi:MAG TPA: DUF4388 domain-containing protein [Myxococcota bacterium]|nr:DUF4388 domain-containing protein [Myxococcota bacterium]